MFSQTLRQLLARPSIVVIPGVYDCISAKLAEQSGFEVAATSGFGIAASTLGLPDYGFMTATEVLSSVGKIAESVNIPIIADMDTGYGNALNVMRTVKDAVKAGIAGVILEDQEFPKKCGHFEGKRVIHTSEHVTKIKAAVKARGDSGLVIIARTDARAVLGLNEAIQRGHEYLRAGADVLFVEAPQSVEELQIIAAAFPNVPLVANIIEGGKTPQLSAAQLEKMGFKIVFFALSALLAATKVMKACLQELKEKGTTTDFQGMVNFSEFKEIIEVSKYLEMEKQFGG
ncbi:carboxyvinyl-carboxyphosphonate phosphorylmutase [Calothrix sp. HK-06]|nr:carboxyvinyl-carboxyphosphonate phosphorylmutase [Calothrix sp. HK-06]